MELLGRVGEIANAVRDPSLGVASALRAFEGLVQEISRLPSNTVDWIGRSEVQSIFGAVFDSLEGRTPGFSAVPSAPPTTLAYPSHPKALNARMKNVMSTRAGRTLLRLAPYFAARDVEEAGLNDDAFNTVGVTYRKHVSFFASLLSTTEGCIITRLAAELAQAEWTERFWNLEQIDVRVGQLVVGNGPVGIAFAHSLIESGDFSAFIVSNSLPGGSFSWGQFPVNHRSRPVGPGVVGGPATSSALDDLGPVLVSPSDINTSWGYNSSAIMAAVTALNAIAAGPTVTAEVDDANSDYNDDGTLTLSVTIRSLTQDRIKVLNPRRGTFALGLGKPRKLRGKAKAMSVQEFLAHPDPSTLGERVAFVGGGDSAMMGVAHLLGLDGYVATPRQVQRLKEIVWFRPEGMIYKETFPIVERQRYGQIASFLPRLLDPNYPSVIKVIDQKVRNSEQEDETRLLYTESYGERVDVVINATGFESETSSLFGSAAEEGEVIYDGRLPVARRVDYDDDANFFAIGACARLPVSDAELERFPILEIEKLSANTVALFRTIPQAVTFGRMSATEGDTAAVAAKQFFSAKAARKVSAAEKNSLEPFEESFSIVGTLVPRTHAALLARIKFLAAVLSEDLPCLVAISISVEMVSTSRVSISASGEVPAYIAEQVLRPLFGDKAIRDGLSYLCRVPEFLGRRAAKMLRESVSASPMVLTLPVVDGKLKASAISLAA